MKEIRKILRAKQNGNCCYCGQRMNYRGQAVGKPKPDDETIEHLKRKSECGTNHWDNIALACHQCNVGRGAVDWFTYKSYVMGELSYGE